MARLIAKSALAGHLPREIGGIAITEVHPGPVTSVAPFTGCEAAVTSALFSLGLRWPEAGEALTSGDARLLWTGRSMALLMGVAPPEGLAAHAALTDQTGALAIMALSGPGLDEALARLVPIDLAHAAFPAGATRRTLIGHMQGSVTRTGRDRFEIAVMRSMGETLIHDLARAIATWAARP